MESRNYFIQGPVPISITDFYISFPVYECVRNHIICYQELVNDVRHLSFPKITLVKHGKVIL